jgi:membrane dipeptidase
MNPTPVFDGHNDTIYSLRRTGRSFFERSDDGHIDLPRARDGGLAGGFFAVWVPDHEHDPLASADGKPDVSAYATAESMPPPLSLQAAQHDALTSLAGLARIERESEGAVVIARTAADLRSAIESGRLAMVIDLEGAEPIDPGLETLEAFLLAGVSSIGLTWSRPNAFAHGVPFGFPGTPDAGPGLTDAGKALVEAANHLRFIIDLSHLNEAGFWDVARLTHHPLIATHSGVHAISPSPRNLTDRQLDAIRDSEGIVGVNFHVGFLRPDGITDAESTTVAHIADHVDYLCDRLGPDKVGLGSDFDGATMPSDLRDAAGLPRLMEELSRRGYDAETLARIGYENWLRVIERTLPA